MDTGLREVLQAFWREPRQTPIDRPGTESESGERCEPREATSPPAEPQEKSMSEPLDNPVWHALTGPRTGFALGRGAARHYPRDIAPFSSSPRTRR
jgi:hypothetical protein